MEIEHVLLYLENAGQYVADITAAIDVVRLEVPICVWNVVAHLLSL